MKEEIETKDVTKCILHGKLQPGCAAQKYAYATTVFDLPQLYTKPAAEDLLIALDLLTVHAPSWDRKDSEISANAAKPQIASEGVTKYLATIISSPLQWLEDDAQKEKIWEEASIRLSERSGRSGMPAMSRTFTLPTRTKPVAFTLHEPSYTGDSIGHKTWAASFLLAKRLHSVILPATESGRVQALELGAGTGLVGMAFATAFSADVLLTDLREIEKNLAFNVGANLHTIKEHGGTAGTAILDWTQPTKINSSLDSETSELSWFEVLGEAPMQKFPVIIAADSIYSAEHPAMLVGAIEAWLAPGPDARVIMEMPRREGYEAELADLDTRLSQLGLRILHEGEEFGYDDWVDHGESELADVKCWWSIWGWGKG
jgi:predicted nicotinamide N-methyase